MKNPNPRRYHASLRADGAPYVIKGLTFDGLDIYTKGKILTKEGIDVFYVLISTKRSTDV